MNDATTPTTPLSGEKRRALRAQAHHLQPVVAIAAKGASPSVMREIDLALKAHDLIKVRLYGIERDARVLICDEICSALGCHAIQHIGNLLVLWRENTERENENTVAAARRKGGSKVKLTKKQAAERGVAARPPRRAATTKR